MVAAALAAAISAVSAASATVPVVPLPTASQLQWQQYEIGVIIHYNMATGKGQGCGIGGAGSPPASSFEPAPTFDAAEWMETSSALGAKYAVYVAKHECGFCTWKTEAKLPDGRTYPYAVGGPNATTVDVVASFVKAARAAGIVPGFYYSISENTYANGLHLTEEQSIALTVAQLSELWGPHGDLAEVWFDGGWRGMKANISGLLASAQPKTVAFNGCNPPDGCIGPDGGNTRWIGTEAGVAPDPCWSTGEKAGAGDPNSTVWNPGEADTTLQNGDNWFWNPSVGLRTLAQLTDVYHSTVGANTNLLLDIAPAPNGSIPANAKARYAEFGAWIKACYGKVAIANVTMPAAAGAGGWTVTVSNAQSADRLVLSEDLSKGQLVRAFTVEVRSATDGWRTVSTKQSIGHKRIMTLPESGYIQLRVNVSKTLNDLPPNLRLILYGGEGCDSSPPCGAASPGQQITGSHCSSTPVDANQAWERQLIAPRAGVNGSDVVRFKLVSSNASAAPLCLTVSGPPAPGEYSNSTTVLPCLNDSTTYADPFDPGATQRFSYDRTNRGRAAGNAIIWEGDGSPRGLPGCVSVGKEAGHVEQAELHPFMPWNAPAPLKDCGGVWPHIAPYEKFAWVAGATANVSALRYAGDGHGSGPLCLGACGVVPQCSFEYDYAYAGPAFATLPHAATVGSCCAACKADARCAVFVLNYSSCALKAAMTGGEASPGAVSGDPNR
jgi:alpha-L-fucosidase